MESLIVNNQKRKKRKTRKNLDAIRKKSRQILFDTDLNKGFNTVINSNNKLMAPKSSICITSKRLTLFRKAVRSDTVSRTILSKNKTHDKENKNCNTDVLEIQTQQQKKPDTNIFTTKSGKQSVNSISCDNKTKSEIDIDKTTSSVILFSPLLHSEDSDTSRNLQINRHEFDPVLSNMASENNLHRENNLYKKFMLEISNYVQQTASMLLKTDIVDKCKNSLRNLYILNEQFKSEDSSASNYDSVRQDSDHERIIKNPIDYIGHSYQEVLKPDSTSSPIVNMSSNSTIRQSSSPLSLIISDSPDYIFYPHRLNQ